jgi:hypothetical protein
MRALQSSTEAVQILGGASLAAGEAPITHLWCPDAGTGRQ